ncbi:hypothetical protein FH972_018379 [Carpinus fangiana]|uniref:Uncharacterized protein n=1 Tax=Carpinus fangiana TaxID=176857 RepID=A0A5N6RNA6_9ROSI|nr:hypothetical protein FH972_018379 [Carpinus fangiana]
MDEGDSYIWVKITQKNHKRFEEIYYFLFVHIVRRSPSEKEAAEQGHQIEQIIENIVSMVTRKESGKKVYHI